MLADFVTVAMTFKWHLLVAAVLIGGALIAERWA